jgi:hypothetical protein
MFFNIEITKFNIYLSFYDMQKYIYFFNVKVKKS